MANAIGGIFICSYTIVFRSNEERIDIVNDYLRKECKMLKAL